MFMDLTWRDEQNNFCVVVIGFYLARFVVTKPIILVK